MTIHRIGVISDTHGLLRSQAKDILQSCTYIIHAGDIDNPAVLGELRRIAPTTAVRGNMDFASWANHLKLVERIQIGKWSILVVHNRADLPLLNNDTNIVIFGHSHQFLQENRGGVLFLNPGSAGPRRFNLPLSMAILTLDETASVQQIPLESKP
ncbi:MAG: metallophosphoesterase family protein [Firmicutes bacterium]|nr:metallophosphoesterase family protein [Bacillota bacterium]